MQNKHSIEHMYDNIFQQYLCCGFFVMFIVDFNK